MDRKSEECDERLLTSSDGGRDIFSFMAPFEARPGRAVEDEEGDEVWVGKEAREAVVETAERRVLAALRGLELIGPDGDVDC